MNRSRRASARARERLSTLAEREATRGIGVVPQGGVEPRAPAWPGLSDADGVMGVRFADDGVLGVRLPDDGVLGVRLPDDGAADGGAAQVGAADGAVLSRGAQHRDVADRDPQDRDPQDRDAEGRKAHDRDAQDRDSQDRDAHDVLARLRATALSTASTAYTAAHGHPLEHPDVLEQPARRWRLALRPALLVGAVLLVVAALVVLRAWTTPEVVPLESSGPAHDPFADTHERVVVHVVGEVAEPGVVELPAGARVSEAVEAAGGATREASLGAVNLARVVEDGEQILVPGPAAKTTADAQPADPRLDLNTADAVQLEQLPGIGPVLAERILAWRTEHGRFSSVAELAEVSGIGPSLLARLSELVRV